MIYLFIFTLASTGKSFTECFNKCLNEHIFNPALEMKKIKNHINVKAKNETIAEK